MGFQNRLEYVIKDDLIIGPLIPTTILAKYTGFIEPPQHLELSSLNRINDFS